MHHAQTRIRSFLKPKQAALLIFLLIIIVLAFLLRTRGLATQNVLFLYDGARDLLYVKKLAVDHDLLLIGPPSGGLQGYFHGVLWYYLLTIPFVLGNGHPAAFTWFVTCVSLASVVAAFVVLKKLSGIVGAVLATIIYSFAGFSVATTKFIWNPYPIVWLMPLYVLAVFAFTKRKPYSLPQR